MFFQYAEPLILSFIAPADWHLSASFAFSNWHDDKHKTLMCGMQKMKNWVSHSLRSVAISPQGTKFHLAVDVGCGSGQSTQMLAKWFEKVIGTDISEAQIEEAKRAAHASNISYA